MTKGNGVHQTKILTKTDQDGFSSAAFRSRIEQKKTPVTECLVCCVCVLFSVAKSMLLNGLCSFLLT